MTMSAQSPLPAPKSVSEAARAALAAPRVTAPWPALSDTDGWEQLVAAADGGMSTRFSAYAFPGTVADRQVAGVRTFVATPTGASTETGPVYLDLHGGALIMGGGDLCGTFAAITASTIGLPTWGVDYRMPPRHPFPAGLDDCLAVYRELLTVRDAADVFIGGNSAGGNLAAALLVRAREEGLPMPAALVLKSPEVDLTESGDSFTTNLAADNVLGSLMEINRLYAAGADLADPHVSPLFADLTGFPPTFLTTGTRDLFLSNAVRMHRSLRAAGVEAELHVFEAMPHGGFGGEAPEDLELAAEQRRFVDRHRRPA
ncbi:alpha/beta hydrolase [Blastococcus sp. URHD0036]|uniref:alpha/beta hydrolase n=1 Tax=Blastococcus sp. URHD0036 TaxID=1380356 RepID=UPI0004964BAB|nr:alpha/beta hydrolase [Blastococcus sp. URHD0036]